MSGFKFNLPKLVWGQKELFTGSRSVTHTSYIGLGDAFAVENHKDKKVVDEGYVSNADVYSIVSRITRNAAEIPFKLYDVKPNGEKTEITKGDLYDLLQNPNDKMTGFEFREQSLGFLLLTGDLFWHGLTSMGFGEAFKQLAVLPSQNVMIDLNPMTGELASYTLTGINRPIKFTNIDSINHEKYFNPSTYGIKSRRGLSPLQAGFLNLKAANSLDVAEASIVENNGAKGIISNESEAPLDGEEQKEMQEVLDERLQGAEKFGKVVVSTSKIKFQQIGMSPTDLKILESGIFKLRKFCNLYHTDSSLFNDPDNKTFANRSEAEKSFYNEAVIPNNEILIKALTNWLLPAWSKQDNKNYVIEQDISKVMVLQEDRFKQSEKVIKERLSGILSGNEAREALGMGKSPDKDMDKVFIAQTLKPIGMEENASE